MRIMSRREKRLTDKPWITKGILTSIKTKNRLYKKYFKNKNNHTDNSQREFYKKYLNKLTHIKNLAKRTYYEKLLKANHKDTSKTWSIIREIVDPKNFYNKSNLPPISLWRSPDYCSMVLYGWRVQSDSWLYSCH